MQPKKPEPPKKLVHTPDAEKQKKRDENANAKIRIWHEGREQIDVEKGTKFEMGIVHFEIEGLHGIVPVVPEGYKMVKSDLEFKEECKKNFLKMVREAGALAVAQTILNRAKGDIDVERSVAVSERLREERNKNGK